MAELKLTEAFMLRLRNLTPQMLADLTFKLGERHPETFIELVMQLEMPEQRPIDFNAEETFKVPFTDTAVTFTQQQLEMLRPLAERSDKKVTCIKEVRTMTGIGLKEAKDLVEQVLQPMFERPHNPW